MDAGVLPSAVADATAVLARCWATSVPVGEARIGNETLELQPPGQASAAAVDAFRTLEAFAREQVVRLAPEGELLMERLPRRACSTSLVRVSRLDALDAHCDSSIATLVVASAPGLEVMTTQGQWQPAPFVCLLRGSDLPRPTVHRVVAAAPRESVCFFVRSEAFPEAGQGWAQLPLPVLAVLVRKLGPLEVIHLSGVCRRFRRALENPHLWLSLAAAEEIQLPPNIELGRVRERCLLSLFPRLHHVPFVTFDLPKPKRDVAGAQRQNLKLVCVGDSGTGKSSLLRYMARTRGGQSDDMWHAVQLTEPDLTCTLSMWDTNGATEYERLRPLVQCCAGLVLVFFLSCALTHNAVLSSHGRVRGGVFACIARVAGAGEDAVGSRSEPPLSPHSSGSGGGQGRLRAGSDC